MEHRGQSWKALSRRQTEISEMVIAGYGNPEIAQSLGLKERTVKAHCQRMFIRFRINDGIKRVKLAVRLYKEDMAQMS